MEKLNRSFYDRDTLEVAHNLIGKYLVRKIGNMKIVGIITEVEAYCGIEDKACHTYGGRKTERTETMYGKPGYAYVYMTYGMYYCLNAVTEKEGNPCAVLIRGIKVIENIEICALNRYNKEYGELKKSQRDNLTNGPGKLCIALQIDKKLNGCDLLGEELYICEKKEKKDFQIITGKRIGIDYAEEYKDKMWRFILVEN